MSGIAKILQKREAILNPSENQSLGKEIWFKDGDQAFLTPKSISRVLDPFHVVVST